MSEMSRDDMLRELELLPMWKLRQPLEQNTQIKAKPATAVVEEVQLVAGTVNAIQCENKAQTENEAQEIAEPQVAEVVEESSAAAAQIPEIKPVQPLRALPSEDGAYLFLMQPAQALNDADTEVLLRNMLRAMRVTCRTETQNTLDQIFEQHAPKLIICLGAEAAEALLQRNHTMAEWRSQQPHRYRDMPLIVTFSPEHLLQHHQDKAFAWQDLCVAMQLQQEL